ncbi:MAG: MmgE/PrpD family protein [Pseudorhodoplanes sp.]
MDDGSGATRVLSAFVTNTRSEDISSDLLKVAKLRLIDCIGAMLIGSRRPWSRAVTAFSLANGGGAGRSTIVGVPALCPPQMAALANGNMAHADEIDDAHDEALSHPGAVVVPAALAAAEERGASGMEFLCAIVLGYELAARAGMGVGAVSHMLRGFYPTGTGCVFGATAAAAKLIALDEGRVAQALGIAGSFASGIVEYANSGGAVKWLHAGRAAEGGITAAYLAEAGFTGPSTALEGRFGFCRVFSDAPEKSRLIENLGRDFAIRSITVKPYACCSDMHTVIDALLAIWAKDKFDATEVKTILVEGPEKLVKLNNIDGTASILAAKYSVPFTVALTLARDIRDAGIYSEEILKDESLASFQHKVRMSLAEDLDKIYPRIIAARVVVELNDGRKMTAESRGALGTVHQPLSHEQVLDKFRLTAASVISRERTDAIMDCVEQIENAADLTRLGSLLRFKLGDSKEANVGH